MDADLADLRDARARFLDLVRELRPELHRYCARMTGSVVDGEDLVQDTLVHAYYALSELESVPALRPWLFRIAHNRAIDLLRRYDVRRREPVEVDVPSDAPSADDALDARIAARAGLVRFLELGPSQRACVILKDVLGHSSREIGEILGLGVGAVEACLHRGRARLKASPRRRGPVSDGHEPQSALVERYAALFQARDWDGVRALLEDDVRLDLVGHARRVGTEVGRYFSNYGGLPPYRVAAGWLEGREGLYVFQHPDDVSPAYFIELVVRSEAVAAIRDYRFVPYLLAELGSAEL